jgi:sugar lactone lactonase YvrE
VFVKDIQQPEGLALDSKNNLYVASNAFKGSVYHVDPSGKKTLLASNLIQPDGLVLDPKGNLYISIETGEGKVLQLSPEGHLSLLISGLDRPEGLVLDEKGNLFIAEDRDNARILQWQEGKLSVLAEPFARPEQMTLDGQGDLCFGENAIHQVTCIDRQGQRKILMKDTILKPDGIHYCKAYEGYFAGEDLMEGRLFFIQKDGRFTTVARRLKFPQGMICDSEGNLYLAENGRDRVLRFLSRHLKTVLRLQNQGR